MCNRIKYPIPKNVKSRDTKDLQDTQKGAYKPAYKNFPETAEGWPEGEGEMLSYIHLSTLFVSEFNK
jgi:hypothetical protein